MEDSNTKRNVEHVAATFQSINDTVLPTKIHRLRKYDRYRQQRASRRRRAPTVQHPTKLTGLHSSVTDPIKSNDTQQYAYNQHSSDHQNTEVPDIPKKRKLIPWLFYSLGLASFLLTFAVGVHTYYTNEKLNDTNDTTLGISTSLELDSQGVSEGTGSSPSESKVTTNVIQEYTVAAEMPRYLRIPDIGVLSRVKTVGIEGGKVGAPRNIYDVSWYNKSSLPGEVGSSLIVGHVTGSRYPGIFENLEKLKKKSKFSIEKGDGTIIEYTVTKTEMIALDEVEMSTILATENAGKHDIKLMTCAGNYDEASDQYDHRYVVYARPI